MIYSRARSGTSSSTPWQGSSSPSYLVLSTKHPRCLTLNLFAERSGVGEKSAAVDCVGGEGEAHHGLRQVHPGRHHPLQADDQHCLQLCSY